jgi:alpha-1,2-mannosyltransferase
MRTEGLRVLLVRSLYAVALIGALAWASLLLWASATNGTLGYDYEAYRRAAMRLLGGELLYDVTATSFGPAGLFFYPPPFAFFAVPFAVLPGDLGKWLWTFGLIAASIAAIAIFPVSNRTRLILVLLAAMSWPLNYAIKLGQVGPALLLLFAIGWRWLDRPVRLGLSIGLGTIIKIQPVLLIGWAILTGRRGAAAVSVVVLAVLAALMTLYSGTQPWFDWLAVLGRVTRPAIADYDTGFGRQALVAGASAEAAALIHYLNIAAVAVVTLVATLRATPVAGYMAVAIATQFASPVLWSHYALVLLLPVAWLIDRGWLWAVLIPLVTSTVVTQVTPAIAYPVSFWVTLLAVTWVGLREQRRGVWGEEGGALLEPLRAPAA